MTYDDDGLPEALGRLHRAILDIDIEAVGPGEAALGAAAAKGRALWAIEEELKCCFAAAARRDKEREESVIVFRQQSAEEAAKKIETETRRLSVRDPRGHHPWHRWLLIPAAMWGSSALFPSTTAGQALFLAGFGSLALLGLAWIALHLVRLGGPTADRPWTCGSPPTSCSDTDRCKYRTAETPRLRAPK